MSARTVVMRALYPLVTDLSKNILQASLPPATLCVLELEFPSRIIVALQINETLSLRSTWSKSLPSAALPDIFVRSFISPRRDQAIVGVWRIRRLVSSSQSQYAAKAWRMFTIALPGERADPSKVFDGLAASPAQSVKCASQD
jgi:hypothetical protein